MPKILIVEDEEAIRLELSLLLHNVGYETEVIKDFTKVAEQIIEAAPDLVLLDVSLPEESGLQICARLRKACQIPVIFVTANNTSMDELNCILQGGDDYVAKPYQSPILLARINAVLKRTMQENMIPQRLTCNQVTLDLAAASISYQGKQAELIDYLWDNQVFIDDNTLSVNITRIRGRLADLGVEDFIRTKRGMGYFIP